MKKVSVAIFCKNILESNKTIESFIKKSFKEKPTLEVNVNRNNKVIQVNYRSNDVENGDDIINKINNAFEGFFGVQLTGSYSINISDGVVQNMHQKDVVKIPEDLTPYGRKILYSTLLAEHLTGDKPMWDEQGPGSKWFEE